MKAEQTLERRKENLAVDIWLTKCWKIIECWVKKEACTRERTMKQRSEFTVPYHLERDISKRHWASEEEENMRNLQLNSNPTHLSIYLSIYLSVYLSECILLTSKLCIRNRFLVVMRLFSNRSHMTSKCGKNYKMAHEVRVAECVTHVFTTFRPLLWSITVRNHDNIELICFM